MAYVRPAEPHRGEADTSQERSLATVTYLMSLSEMARTPFSLVDEINQGMDQKAERAVHNQLVETTCGADTGQYFLITPKLLTNLHYHRRMKVLVVNSGQHRESHIVTLHWAKTDVSLQCQTRERRDSSGASWRPVSSDTGRGMLERRGSAAF